ncbi:tetratricopeptide repeat protein [Tianweitania populi]|uniref:Membrane protein n=1 Tax=Tianweitania populi TaxID=1607949 RepID=A0A8J3DS93_9HYPH|nr:tetratricopeptide repeat protein [Tianweitania populi]GHD05725.1 membrane protein [Tianweitania populi]
MSDTFFREVNQEMRQAQAQAIWTRFGPIAIVVALLIVLATGGWVLYDWWSTNKANASGDQFSQALQLASEGKTDEAAAALQTLEDNGVGAYPLLARLRMATVLAQKGDFTGSVAALDQVAADSAIPQGLRDVAKLRAGLVLVDHGSFADVEARVGPLNADTNPLRHSAREALALSAWKENRPADALPMFQQIIDDQAAPGNLRQRATMMVELIRGSGVN